jgi:hypothetical protein
MTSFLFHSAIAFALVMTPDAFTFFKGIGILVKKGV